MQVRFKSENEGSLLSPSLDNYPPLPMGRALMVMLESGDREWSRAILMKSSEDFALNQALSSVRKHLSGNSTSMHSICVSIIGQVLQYKKGNEPKRIFDIFKFLFKNYPSELTQCLCKILQGTDKKHKLGALRLLENIVVSFCSIFLAVKPLKGNKEALFLDMKQLVNLLVALLGVVENDSILHLTSRQPTTLTMLAAYVFLLVQLYICLVMQHPPEEKPESPKEFKGIIEELSSSETSASERVELSLFVHHLPICISLIEELSKWYKLESVLYSEALNTLSYLLKSLDHTLSSFIDQGQPYDAPLQFLLSLLVSCIPLIIQDRVEISSKPSKTNKKLAIQQVSSLENMVSNSDVSPEKAKLLEILIWLSLHFGKMRAKAIAKAIKSSSNFEALAPLLVKLLSVKDAEIGNIALQLLQTAIGALNYTKKSGSEFDDSLVFPLLDLLADGSKDMASTAVVAMLARYVIDEYPRTRILDAVLSHIDSRIKRPNAILVLSEVFRIQHDFAQASAKGTKSDHRQELSNRLGRELLNRIEDEQLATRLEATKLFCFLEPSIIIPMLVPKIYSQNVKVRSAADSALVNLLSNHVDPQMTFFVLLESLITFSKEAVEESSPLNPASMLESKKPTQPKNLDFDKVLRLIPKWARRVEQICDENNLSADAQRNVWKSFTRSYIELTFKYPSELILVKCTVHLSPWISKYRSVIIPLFVEKLNSLPRLTEAMVYQQGNNSEVAQLLYTLLGPLLTLRSLADEAFYSETEDLAQAPSALISLVQEVNTIDTTKLDTGSKDLFLVLLDMALSPLQFDDIRKLSGELCTRFPVNVTFPIFLERMQKSLLVYDPHRLVKVVLNMNEDKKETELVLAKTFLLFFCASLAKHGEKIEEYLVRFVPHIIRTLEWPDFNPECKPAEQDLSNTKRIQHGCLDFFSLALIIFFTIHKTSEMPKPRSEQISPQTTTTTKTTSTPILENTKLTRPFEFLEIGTKKTSSLLITPTDVKDHVVEDEPGPSLGTDDIRRSAINTKSLIQPITENNSIIPEITGPQRRDWAVNPISSFADIKEFIEQHFTMKGWDDAGPEVLQTCMWMGNIILNTTKMNPGELTMRNVMNWAFSLVLRNFWEVENTLLRDIYIRVLFMISFKRTQTGYTDALGPYLDEMFDICLFALGEAEPEQVRLEGLKLLGSVLGALSQSETEQQHITSLETKFFTLQQRLDGIRNIDQSAECRALAEKYFTLLIPKS